VLRSILSAPSCIKPPSSHLGLAIELYHEYGSRTLIETLFSHGFCASYTEVRRYLTSIAVHEVENMENGAFAPDGIISVQEGGGLIQEGGSLAFSKDLSSINHARNFVRVDGIFSKDVPRETSLAFG
jgi:hypothetical protein